MEIITWLKANWESILAIIGGVVSVATIIVKLTPTQKDDNVLATIIRVLAIFSLVNPDGSFIGKKADWMLKVAKFGFMYVKAKEKGYIPKIEITDKLYMPITKEVVKGKFIKLTWRFWNLMFFILSVLFLIILFCLLAFVGANDTSFDYADIADIIEAEEYLENIKREKWNTA